MPQSPQAHELYLKQMIEAKCRIKAIDRILGAKKPFTQNLEIDNESAFLQLRKIVELITFSAIISDEQRYQRSRQLDAAVNTKDRGDYTLDWNAAEILKHLSKISPHFLPRPLGNRTTDDAGVVHFNEAAAKASHDRLISIYKAAGGFAHIPNPYKLSIAELEKSRNETARTVLVKELAYIKSIIWEHAKIGLEWTPGTDPKQVDQSETAWLIWFGDQSTDQVRMALAVAK
jgi:hypothetical protein